MSLINRKHVLLVKGYYGVQEDLDDQSARVVCNKHNITYSEVQTFSNAASKN